MKHLNRTAATVSALALFGLALAACSSNSSSASSSASASSSSSSPTASPTGSQSSSSIGGGSAKCEQAQLTSDVNAVVGPNGGKVTKVQTYKCAEGWSYVIASTKTSNGVTATGVYVFQAEGPYWVYKDLKVACGTSQPTAQIPAALYKAACTQTQ